MKRGELGLEDEDGEEAGPWKRQKKEPAAAGKRLRDPSPLRAADVGDVKRVRPSQDGKQARPREESEFPETAGAGGKKSRALAAPTGEHDEFVFWRIAPDPMSVPEADEADNDGSDVLLM
jgi:hypothetical protein